MVDLADVERFIAGLLAVAPSVAGSVVCEPLALGTGAGEVWAMALMLPKAKVATAIEPRRIRRMDSSCIGTGSRACLLRRESNARGTYKVHRSSKPERRRPADIGAYTSPAGLPIT